MKYLFIITGIAYGHLTREEAIINKLKELDKKAEIVVAGYETSYKYFKNKYKMLKLNSVVFPGSFGRFRSVETLIKNYNVLIKWIKNIHIVNKFIKDFNPDVIISDWEPFALFIKRCNYLIWNYKPKYSKANSLTLFIQRFLVGLGYFIAGVSGKKIIIPSFKKEINYKNYIYTDLIVRNRPNEIKPLEKYQDSILVMIGGADFGLNLASKIDNISKNFNEKFIFFGYKPKSKNCIGYKEFRNNYLNYLKSCKAVISLGGYSGISESIIFNKPNLAFPIKNQVEQEAVVEEFKNYIEIGDIESSEEELIIIIKNFLNKLNKMKKKISTLKIKNGADEIAKILYKESKS